MSKKENKGKGLLVQRFAAYIIDILLISFVVSLVSTPFINSDKESSQLINNVPRQSSQQTFAANLISVFGRRKTDHVPECAAEMIQIHKA